MLKRLNEIANLVLTLIQIAKEVWRLVAPLRGC